MKISEITGDYIKFDNGDLITFDHDQDCCEHNYADFMYVDDDKYNYDVNFKEIGFEYCNGFGFKIYDKTLKYDFYSIVIPCYSEQNGYYTTDIDIYYNDKKVLSGSCACKFS